MNEAAPKEGDVIAVWFSSGAASAIAAKKTVGKYGNVCTVRLVNNPVAEEDADNLRFLRDVQDWIGIEVESATHKDYPNASAVEVWDRRGGMAFPHGAPCTVALKKQARQQFEARNHVDWHVLGFTADERQRHQRFVMTERSNLLPVLIDAPLTKEDCFEILRNAGLELPRVYSMGYPNANCIGCVKASSASYWTLVREMHPEVFAERAEQSRRLGSKLVRYKGERIYLDELPLGAMGRPLKSMKAVECGLFCEEPGPRLAA